MGWLLFLTLFIAVVFFINLKLEKVLFEFIKLQ